MLMRYILLFVSAFIFITTGISQSDYFRYSSLPDLPPNTGYSHQPGLAGPYTGVDDNYLIVAGGANFLNKLSSEGGAKVYHDEIFVLRKDSSGEYTWIKMAEKMPFSSAYGGAVSTPYGLMCFGGSTSSACIAESWLIDYVIETGVVEIKPGPALPVPLANFAFSVVDGTVYVAGGISDSAGPSGNYFFGLRTKEGTPRQWKWETLPPWEGESRAFATGVGQSDGLTNCFYLFSGRNIQPGRDAESLYDAHVYNPVLKKWKVISEGRNKEFPFMDGTSFPLGAATIIFTSGASGKHLIAFNTITHKTYKIDDLPATGQLKTTAVKLGNEVFIPTGESAPGLQTAGTLKMEILKSSRHLSFIDIIVIVLYFLVLAWMGYFFSKRQKNTNDYFKGGGRIPWWAAGLSIFGTALSAITFMAIPSKTYATDWSYFMLNMTIFMVAPLIVFLFIPFYRRMNITTAYEYLENRFSLAVRLIGSLSFILFQVGRMGVVLFLPSIALNVVTGINIFLCIGVMGFISLIYTMMGGIEAVIWTDVMQVIVLLGGAVLSIFIITMSVDNGLKNIFETAAANDKFNIFDLTWSLKQPTLWVMLLGGFFANIATYGTDQTMVQRYLTTKSEKAAAKSVWTNAVLAIPATLIFFFIGTALFVFYENFPADLNPTFENNDAIFPWYIASRLPVGVSGLLIAGVFAAAMSTLSSSMNSAATAYSTDIHFRFGWNRRIGELKIARIVTLIIGLIGILFAFMMATMDVKSLWDEFQKILGLVIGSLGGVFLLGILTKRANYQGALIGIAVSIIVQIFVGIYQPVHLTAYSATGVVSCFVAGYAGSLFFKTAP
jgi:SSS family transporter